MSEAPSATIPQSGGRPNGPSRRAIVVLSRYTPRRIARPLPPPSAGDLTHERR